MAFFCIAIDPHTWDRLWLADFGADPQIRTLNANWELIVTKGFTNPFATGDVINAANPALEKMRNPVIQCHSIFKRPMHNYYEPVMLGQKCLRNSHVPTYAPVFSNTFFLA